MCIYFCPFADETLYYNVIAGVIAGAVSSAICNPTDVLKVKSSLAFSSFTWNYCAEESISTVSHALQDPVSAWFHSFSIVIEIVAVCKV